MNIEPISSKKQQMKSEKRDNKTRRNKQDIDKLKSINFEDYTEEDFQRDFNGSNGMH